MVLVLRAGEGPPTPVAMGFELEQRVSGRKNREVLYIEVAYLEQRVSGRKNREDLSPPRYALAALYVHSKGGKRPHVLYKQIEQTY